MEDDQERIRSLTLRVWELEQRVARLEDQPAPIPAPPLPAPPPLTVRPEPPPRILPAPIPVKAAPAPPSPVLETRLGLTWLNRVGVVTLILFAGFFFKYAADNDWIGPLARLALGIAAAGLALGVGHFFYGRAQRLFAQGLTGLGIALLYVTFYASFESYKLIPHGADFGLVVATTLLACALAELYDARAIALLGLTGGYLTPLLLSNGEDHPRIFFSYVLLVDGGAFLLARRRQWPVLEKLAFAWTLVLSVAWLMSSRSQPSVAATLFVFLAYLLFAFARTRNLPVVQLILGSLMLVAIWRNTPITFLPLSIALSTTGLAVAYARLLPRVPAAALAGFWLAYAFLNVHPLRPSLIAITLLFALFTAWSVWRRDLLVLALNGPLYFTGAYLLLDPHYHSWTGLLAITLAAIHLAIVYLLRDTDTRAAVFALGVALGFSVLAVPVQFTGFRIAGLWALEAAAFAWLGKQRAELRFSYVAYAVLVLAMLAGLHNASEPATTTIVNARFLALTIIAVAAWLVSYWSSGREARLIAYIAGHAFLLLAGAAEIADWTARNVSAGERISVESVALSVVVAAYALVLIALGIVRGGALLRTTGLAPIALVILKLYLYDVWLLGIVYRMAAFGVLGALLMLTSYFYSRYREKIEALWRDRAAGPLS